MANLEAAVNTLMNRLENAISRLESVEKQVAQGGGGSTSSKGSSSSSTSGGLADSSPSVQEFEDLIKQFIVPYVDISKKLDSLMGQQAELWLQAVNAERDLLRIAASCKKPSDSVIQGLFKPIADLGSKIIQLRESNRSSKFFNNLSAVSEAFQALGWVLISPTPGPHVNETKGSSEFYSNRILKEFKGKDQVQVDWVNSFNGFLKELIPFIKKFHTTGLEWNARGGDASGFSVGGGSSSSDSSDSPPPPPGPPPPPLELDNNPSKDSKNVDMSGVFAELSKGTDVSKGLRKVTADMKTKNRTDKTSIVPASTSQKASTSSSTQQKVSATRPPKLELEGNKWMVANQIGNKAIVISETESKQTCYIYKCKESVIQIKGKINAITLDDCTKCGVVFETVVSSCEIVNCQSVEVQATGKVPSFAIDKTSGCQLYLSKDALDTEIVTSKTSEMNVLIPGVNKDDDMIEMPVPEQYKSTIRNNKLVTEIVHHV